MGFYMCEFFRDPMVHLGTATRVCFVKFKDPSSVHVAQHLTNTVFIDRALIVVPVQDGEFIEREYQDLVFHMLTLLLHPHTPSNKSRESLLPPIFMIVHSDHKNVLMKLWSCTCIFRFKNKRMAAIK